MSDQKKVVSKGEKPSVPEFKGILISGLFAVIPLIAVFFYGVVGEDKFILLSPLVIVGYLLLLVWLTRSALSKNTFSVAPPGFYPFLLYLLYGIVLALSCQVVYEAKIRLLMVGLCVGSYYLWANSVTGFRISRSVLLGLLAFALLASCYGLINFYKQPEMVLWTERYTTTYKDVSRLASTYICPNHFAHLLQMLLPFCLVLLFIKQAGLFLRILAGYCMVVFIPVICLTQSRAGMLGAIAALGITILLMALRKSKKLFLTLLVAVPLLSSLILIGAWQYSGLFRQRMTPVVEFITDLRTEGFANTKTHDFRPLTWLDSIDMIKARPVAGFGPGSYRYAFPEYRNRYKGARVLTGHPHNEYLEIAAEYGLVGFGLFALAWCWGLVRLLIFSLKTKNQHHAFMAMAFLGTAAGTMLHSFFDFEMHVFQNALVFALLAAMAAGPMCGRRKEKLIEMPHSISQVASRGSAIVLASLVVIGFIMAAQTFSSAFIRAAADRFALSDSIEKAKQYYSAALRVDPSNWRAYKGLGLLWHNERYYCLDPAEKHQLAVEEEAIQRKGYVHNPLDAELAMDLGKTRYFLGDVEAGLELMKHAANMRPFNDIAWWTLGVYQRKANRYAEALETFKYTARIRNSPSTRLNIEWIEKQIAEDNGQNKEVEGFISAHGQPPIATEWTIPDPTNAVADPGLINLLDRMGP